MRLKINKKKFLKSFIIIFILIFGIVILFKKNFLKSSFGDESLFGNDDDFSRATSSTSISNINLIYDILPYSKNVSIPEYTINMRVGDKYTLVKGITTFRGNNYRDTASYGTVEVNDKVITEIWKNSIGSTDSWTGVGWNGQPAIVQWDENVKKNMNLYEKFKNKSGFTEVIYGTLDSHIYFYDLETGEPSRDALKISSAIKGSVTVDPRGLPLLYVGQGIDTVNGKSVQMGYYIFSLITGEQLFFLNGYDSFAYRKWGAFDGNPIIDEETDSIILPAENGMIYFGKLNTKYDESKGTVSIEPKLNRYRYTSSKNNSMLGLENAMTIYKHYAYFTDNAGVLQCLDLNTWKPVWVSNMGDDCDATLGLEEEDGHLYLYSGSEVDLQAQDGYAYVRKIDGQNGNIVWENKYFCYWVEDVNGGVLASPVIGKNDIDDLVIFNIAKTGDNEWRGKMVALYKENGDVAWEITLDSYCWSSPVAVYSLSGKSYIIQFDSNGNGFLIEGSTGKICYKFNHGGGNVEASPAVFNDMVVVGTRGQKIFGFKIQ